MPFMAALAPILKQLAVSGGTALASEGAKRGVSALAGDKKKQEPFGQAVANRFAQSGIQTGARELGSAAPPNATRVQEQAGAPGMDMAALEKMLRQGGRMEKPRQVLPRR